jgi:hypothetical protein
MTFGTSLVYQSKKEFELIDSVSAVNFIRPAIERNKNVNTLMFSNPYNPIS